MRVWRGVHCAVFSLGFRQVLKKSPDCLKGNVVGPAGPPVLVSIGIWMMVSPMKARSIGVRHSNTGTRSPGITTRRFRAPASNCLFAVRSALCNRSKSSPHQAAPPVIWRKGAFTSTLMSPSGSLMTNSSGCPARPSGRGSIRSRNRPARYHATRHSLIAERKFSSSLPVRRACRSAPCGSSKSPQANAANR